MSRNEVEEAVSVVSFVWSSLGYINKSLKIPKW